MEHSVAMVEGTENSGSHDFTVMEVVLQKTSNDGSTDVAIIPIRSLVTWPFESFEEEVLWECFSRFLLLRFPRVSTLC